VEVKLFELEVDLLMDLLIEVEAEKFEQMVKQQVILLEVVL
jgi:hypothetical protein